MRQRFFERRDEPFNQAVRLLHRAYVIYGIAFWGIFQLLMSLYVIRLGYGPQYLGYYMASGAVAYMLGGIPNGALGQRWGTRRVMLIGSGMVVAAMVLLPLAESVPPALARIWPIAVHMLLSWGWSMVSVNVIPAMMAVTTPRERNRAFSVNWALLSLGTLGGNLLGGVLPGWFGGVLGVSTAAPAPYRYAIWVGAALQMAVFWPLARLDPQMGISQERQRQTTARPWRAILLVSLTLSLCQAGVAAPQIFGNPYLDAKLQVPTAAIGAGASIAQVLAALAAFSAPRLSRRWGDRRTLTGVYLLVVCMVLPLALWAHWLPAMVGVISIRALSALALPIFHVFQMERVDDRARGLMAGATAMSSGAMFTTMSLVGGHVIAARGYSAIFWAGSAVCLLGIGFLTASTRFLPIANKT